MKQKIALPSGGLKPKDLSRVHYTTLGFGSIQPILCEEVVPKDKCTFSVRNFSRVSPMFLPNLGTLNMKIHAFYVPFRLVWNHFDNFKEGLPSWNSNGAQVYRKCPHIDDKFITSMFTEMDYNLDVPKEACFTKSFPNITAADVAGGWDFKLNTENLDSPRYYQLTKLGCNVYSVLCALGYNFNFIDDRTGSELNSEYSALPLLCYFKLFLDYYIPSQFQPSSYINQLFSKLHDMTAAEMNAPLTELDFVNCFIQCQYFYQNNYFSSAWQSPNAVIPGLNNIGQIGRDNPLQINTIDSQGNKQGITDGVYSFGQSDNGVYVTTELNHSVNNPPVSADSLNFIQKFARFVKRSNFAGSRVVERILARYGVRVDDFQIGMSKYLGSDTLTLQKTDVTSTTQNDDVSLGDYSGKGWFSSEGKVRQFKCNCDYFGMVFALASIETPSTPLTGVRRRNMHVRPLDFWTPEFDGGLFQAISGQELYGREYDMNSSVQTIQKLGLNRDRVFGFGPRYQEYKIALDDISGNFAIPRLSQNIDPFILPRRIFDRERRYSDTHGHNGQLPNNKELYNYVYDQSLVQDDGSVINKITPTKLLFGNDMYQFNRIFRDTDGVADPIFSVFNIPFLVNSPTLPLNESAEIVGKGKMLEFETNGQHL